MVKAGSVLGVESLKSIILSLDTKTAEDILYMNKL